MYRNQHNVLILDKDIEHLHSLFQYLEATQIYNVLSASSGDMAALIIEKKTIDLAIIDWETVTTARMDLLKKLKDKYEDKVPNIFIATQEDFAGNERFIKENASDFLSKPVSATKLVQVAQEILGKQQLPSLKETLLTIENKLIAQEKSLQEKEKDLVQRERIVQKHQDEFDTIKNTLQQEQLLVTAQKQALDKKKLELDAIEQEILKTQEEITLIKNTVQQDLTEVENQKKALEQKTQALEVEAQQAATIQEDLNNFRKELLLQQQEFTQKEEALKVQEQTLEKLKQELNHKAEELEIQEKNITAEKSILENSKLQEEQTLQAKVQELAQLLQETQHKIDQQEKLLAQKEEMLLNQTEELELLRNQPPPVSTEVLYRYQNLVRYVLPPKIQAALNESETSTADFYPQVNSLILGIENLELFQQQVTEEDYQENFHQIIQHFHYLIEKYNVEPVKSREGVYSFLQDLRLSPEEAAVRTAEAALELGKLLKKYQQQCALDYRPYLSFSVTVTTVSIIAGKAQEQNFAYDVWGDLNKAINTQGRNIFPLMTEPFLERVKDKVKFRPFGQMQSENKGIFQLYILEAVL